MSSPELKILGHIVDSLRDGQISKSSLSEALKALSGHADLGRSMVLLHQPETDKLILVAVSGLGPSEFRKLEGRADKTFLREIFDAGGSEFITREKFLSELDFLSAADSRMSGATVAVIATDGRAQGVLMAEHNGEPKESDRELISVTASLIAQNLRVENAIDDERKRLAEETSHLRQELREKYDFSQIIGNSSPMRHVYDQVTQVARSNATVLLRGESGTGKELIAQAIHYNSLRARQPFVKVNCAALPETLIESELFGYEKGAFTGAERLKKGRFELADGGTIFLDEIGDLPPQTQIKLLRVLQEREFERLGGTETIKVNVRIITATNKNLENAIADGVFREDLFYRLNVFTIFLPPMRERKADILLLAEHFLARYEKEHGKNIKRISTPAIDMLTSYHFPGNVRELENVIERAVLVCDSNVIHGHHLPPTLQTAEVSGTETRGSLDAAVEAFERDLIQDALKSSSGNVAKAARTLESTERIIGYKIKKFGIDVARFRQEKPAPKD